jgi:hypothetical protein
LRRLLRQRGEEGEALFGRMPLGQIQSHSGFSVGKTSGLCRRLRLLSCKMAGGGGGFSA